MLTCALPLGVGRRARPSSQRINHDQNQGSTLENSKWLTGRFSTKLLSILRECIQSGLTRTICYELWQIERTECIIQYFFHFARVFNLLNDQIAWEDSGQADCRLVQGAHFVVHHAFVLAGWNVPARRWPRALDSSGTTAMELPGSPFTALS